MQNAGYAAPAADGFWATGKQVTNVELCVWAEQSSNSHIKFLFHEEDSQMLFQMKKTFLHDFLMTYILSYDAWMECGMRGGKDK